MVENTIITQEDLLHHIDTFQLGENIGFASSYQTVKCILERDPYTNTLIQKMKYDDKLIDLIIEKLKILSQINFETKYCPYQTDHLVTALILSLDQVDRKRAKQAIQPFVDLKNLQQWFWTRRVVTELTNKLKII